MKGRKYIDIQEIRKRQFLSQRQCSSQPSCVVTRGAGCCTKGPGFEFRVRHGMSNCPSMASPMGPHKWFCAKN